MVVILQTYKHKRDNVMFCWGGYIAAISLW